jgi:hypothetical protein
MFVLIGADPCTGWLREALATDDDGFVVTGDARSPISIPQATVASVRR